MQKAILLLFLASAVSLAGTAQIRQIFRDSGRRVLSAPIREPNSARPADPATPIPLNVPAFADSIKLPKATEQDWLEYGAAYDRLEKTITWDTTKNVENYIEINEDLGRLSRIEKKYLDLTPKLILHQISANLDLLSQLLKKRLTDTIELKLLTAIIANINALIYDYLAAVGLGDLAAVVPPISLRVSVIGKDHRELSNAQCYFLTPHTCRDVRCGVCETGQGPCNGGDINSIIGQADFSYDCANPHNIDVTLGSYLIFVIVNDKVIHYEPKKFVASDADAAKAGNNQLKLIIE
jgi:hypothetical protein